MKQVNPWFKVILHGRIIAGFAGHGSRAKADRCKKNNPGAMVIIEYAPIKIDAKGSGK